MQYTRADEEDGRRGMIYSVVRREREIGIRVSVGAGRTEVMRQGCCRC
jgi:hypothetical protein